MLPLDLSLGMAQLGSTLKKAPVLFLQNDKESEVFIVVEYVHIIIVRKKTFS